MDSLFFSQNYFLSSISFQWSVLWFLVYCLDNIFCMIMIPSIYIKQIIYKNIKYIKETDPTPHWPRSGIMGRERKGSLFWDKDTADFAKKYSRSASYTVQNIQIQIHKFKYKDTKYFTSFASVPTTIQNILNTNCIIMYNLQFVPLSVLQKDIIQYLTYLFF